MENRRRFGHRVWSDLGRHASSDMSFVLVVLDISTRFLSMMDSLFYALGSDDGSGYC